MRVFVTGTGRCGTSTFYHACRHMTNYTAGHESAACYYDYQYPDWHIEASGGLSFFVGTLLKRHPASKWVLLKRNRWDTIDSLVKQSAESMRRFGQFWLYMSDPDPFLAADVFYETVHDLIHAAVPKGQLRVMEMERAKDDWRDFWKWIGAEGDFDASLAEWDRKYNSSAFRGRNNFIPLGGT